MKPNWKKIGQAVPRVLAYLLFLAGAALVVYGIWELSHSAAFIVSGLLLAGGGFLAALAPDPFEEEW